MTTVNGLVLRSRDGVTLTQRISDAAHAVDSAKRTCSADRIVDAQANLRAVVQAANDDGMSWQSIGDTLGMRRGAAYQRFRRRPDGTLPQLQPDALTHLPL
jgi:hypothetical protein